MYHAVLHLGELGLQGIVDDQTLLSQLWFIRDPAEAVENLRRQREETEEL